MRTALVDAAWGLLCLAVVTAVLILVFPEHLGLRLTALLLPPAAGMSGSLAGLYVRDKWLVRTSYHGLDLVDGQRVRIPWAAIDGLSVRRQTLRVSVGRPGDVTNINNSRWKTRRSEYTVTTPEIEALVADLAIRLPYLMITRET